MTRVVIVGGGFAGLAAARALAHQPVQVTIIDRRNHHLFQPLLYQVATAALSPADIASPIRSVVRRQKNASVLLGEVTGFDLAQTHTVQSSAGDVAVRLFDCRRGRDEQLLRSSLEWETFAVGLKDVDEAVEIRRRVLGRARSGGARARRSEAEESCSPLSSSAAARQVSRWRARCKSSRLICSHRDFRRLQCAS